MQRALCFGMVTLIIGCALQDSDPTPPVIPTHALKVPPPPPSVPVEFVDVRPEWERHFYEGTDSPEHYREAISFVPVESLQPTLEDQLRQELDHQWQFTPDRPTALKITLTSFRLVFNDVERMREEHKIREEQQKKIDDQMNRHREMMGWEDDADQDIAGVILGAILGAIVKGAVRGAGEASRQRRMISLPGKYRDQCSITGLSCIIEAQVTWFWPGGHTQEQRVEGSAFDQDASVHPTGNAIPDIVQQAVRSFTRNLQDQTQTQLQTLPANP